MKSVKKAIVAALCAGTLVVGSVAGTMAYLTSTDEVVNTFTVGNVAITLDEAKVNTAGYPIDENNDKVELSSAPRVKENTYKLVPGHSYTKDQIVNVDDESEDCDLVVKVENGIADIEAASVQNGYQSIVNQIITNGWIALDGVEDVYYRDANTETAAKGYTVFGNFAIAGDGVVGGNKPADYNGNDKYISDYTSSKIKVTAYAVQKDGFNTANDAWNATFGKSLTNSEAE